MLQNILKLPLAILAIGSFFNAQAQKAPGKNWPSSKIIHELHRLAETGKVLYVAAHPDDENTRFIAYCVNQKGYETSYISLTRGDGGQNLIGPEVREKLGLIRTQELLMARETDGGKQLFSRANDFGFSKTAQETFSIWDREKVLSDLVWAIRKVKPDIIVTRFSPTYTKTHGHHQASAILASEAFAAAGDSSKFAEQVAYTGVWQAKSLFWNTSTFFFQQEKFDTTGLFSLKVGTYLPLLGKSVAELAAESRSMHKSQGFGSSPARGDISEYFVHLAGQKPSNKDITSLINNKWESSREGKAIENEIKQIIKSFNPEKPENSVEALAELHKSFEKNKKQAFINDKIADLEKIILQCAGIYQEALSTKEYWPLGDSINVSLAVLLQSTLKLSLKNASLVINQKKNFDFTPKALNRNEYVIAKVNGVLDKNTNITGPYWLEDSIERGMYTVSRQVYRGLAQNQHAVQVKLTYEIETKNGVLNISQEIPVYYKISDPVKGEINKEVAIIPPASAAPTQQLLVFADNKTKILNVKTKVFGENATLKPILPAGWQVKPSSYLVKGSAEGNEQSFDFEISAESTAKDISKAYLSMEQNGNTYARSIETIDYDHLPRQVLLPKAEFSLLKLDIKTKSKSVGYISGAGDEVPKAIKQLGYNVELINIANANLNELKKYDAIIAGVRAYNTVNELKTANPLLLEYVNAGGNYIVQYNTSFNLVTKEIGPFPLTLSHDRVTEEDAEVKFIDNAHPILNSPNKLSKSDFDNWVQERGLYFPEKWAPEYTPILEMHDTNDKTMQSSILVAKYGKGNFIYTGLSFFRELPAGVPGAYRLLANMIELGK